MEAQETGRAPEPGHGSTQSTAHGHAAQFRHLDDTSQRLLEYQLRALGGTRPAPEANVDADIIPAQSPHEMERELSLLPRAQRLYEGGDFRVVVLRQSQAPHVVLEIGRLREIAFRAVGEGTGRPVDLDDYDTYYQHLLVWSRSERAVLGSYRLAMADVVCARSSCDDLYTRSLFTYDASLLADIGPAIELGRSFVRKEYQRSSRVLAMLWKGIGQIISTRPRYHTLFGPVSISALYTEASRQLIASALSCGEFRHPLANRVAPLRPPATHELTGVTGAESLQELSDYISALEPDGKGLPTLVKEYGKLGGRFLSFSIDPDFGSAMDGLVAVDLRRTNPRLLSLYMGPEAYQRFKLAAVDSAL
jgi:putative hemolysin